MPTKTLYKPSATAATKRANAVLELDDLARLSVALAEVGADEAMHNRTFAAKVRDCYEHLPPSKTKTKADPTRALKVTLVPLRQYEGHRIDTSRPLDPYFILEAYGPEQLPIALELFSVERLKEGSAMVEKRNPGTKPSNRGHKSPLISYIVSRLT